MAKQLNKRLKTELAKGSTKKSKVNLNQPGQGDTSIPEAVKKFREVGETKTRRMSGKQPACSIIRTRKAPNNLDPEKVPRQPFENKGKNPKRFDDKKLKKWSNG